MVFCHLAEINYEYEIVIIITNLQILYVKQITYITFFFF